MKKMILKWLGLDRDEIKRELLGEVLESLKPDVEMGLAEMAATYFEVDGRQPRRSRMHSIFSGLVDESSEPEDFVRKLEKAVVKHSKKAMREKLDEILYKETLVDDLVDRINRKQIGVSHG